jgi:hypothetical protein
LKDFKLLRGDDLALLEQDYESFDSVKEFQLGKKEAGCIINPALK